MVSEFALPKDVVPEFQVWSNGERVGKDEERRLINNENIEARTFKDHVLTFKTPTQDVNNLHEIYTDTFKNEQVLLSPGFPIFNFHYGKSCDFCSC